MIRWLEREKGRVCDSFDHVRWIWSEKCIYHFYTFSGGFGTFLCTVTGDVLLMSFCRGCIWDERRKAHFALLFLKKKKRKKRTKERKETHHAITRVCFAGEWKRMTGSLYPHTFPRYPAQLSGVACTDRANRILSRPPTHHKTTANSCRDRASKGPSCTFLWWSKGSRGCGQGNLERLHL